jgi:hypothetical protein
VSGTFTEQLDEAIHSLAQAHRACLQLRQALITITDLFCGAGGSSLGAELAGGTLRSG